ncbi:unnamed protein product, partial [Closterium sp. NIES-53]
MFDKGHECYFVLVVDDYSRYTTVFPLRSKGEVLEVLIDWIRGASRQLCKHFGSDLPVLRLHSNRGGEFSSDLLRAFCRAEGIHQTFTLPASPQQNGIAEHRIGMVMDVARTSMIHAAAPHFLWPFAVQYAAHQLNLQPRVSLPETTPTLRWTGKVGDASAFHVWGSRAFVRDTSADKLSSRAVPCVFLGFPPDALGWQFYHPTSRRVLSSQDVTFDESVSYCRLVPYRTASIPPPPLFLAPGASWGAEPAGAGTGGAEPGGAEPERVESGGAEPEIVEPGGAEPERVEPGGAKPAGTASGGAEPARAESGDSPGVPLQWELLLETLELRVLPASPLPGPSPYSGPTRGLMEHRAPESRPVSPESCPASPKSRSALPVRTVRAGSRVSCPRLPFVPCTHSMTLRPSTAPQRVPLPSPPASSLPDGRDPESDSLRAASPTVTRFLATAVTEALFESTTASALVAELSPSASVCPPSVGGECALGTDVLKDRQEEFECFVTAVPHLVSMLLDPKGDTDAPDIPTPRSYTEAIMGPYSSKWQKAMDAEMASWKSTSTYIDAVHPSGANIVDGMLIFIVKWPPGSPPVFKARYGNLHEEIWLRRPPGFTGSFPAGTQWSLRRPVYGLRQAPRERHNTLRTTLATLGFAPSTVDPSLFLRSDTTLPPFYVLVYVDDLVFTTADTEALAHVKSELQKRHTCTDL